MTDEEAARLVGLPHSRFPTWTQGILITDSALADNPIIYANSGFLKLTGYALEEVIGRNCRLLQGAETNQTTVAQIRTAVAERKSFHGTILNYRRDGSSFLNQLTIGPVRGPDKDRYFVGLQLDVTPIEGRGRSVG